MMAAEATIGLRSALVALFGALGPGCQSEPAGTAGEQSLLRAKNEVAAELFPERSVLVVIADEIAGLEL